MTRNVIVDNTSSTESNVSSASEPLRTRRGILLELATFIDAHSIPFSIISIGMIVMLLWAGAYKMTASGAESITPLVTHSPLIWWHFRLFGPYVGSDLIGVTEVTAAALLIAGYWKPKAGILGGLIAVIMFFTTSTMLLSTPGATTVVNGMRYMSFLGLFLFKDVISLGASFYLISRFGRRALLLSERE